MQRIILSLASHIALIIYGALVAPQAAAQHQVTYEKLIFERSSTANDRSWSKLLFTIEGFRIDGSCYHDCDISFSLNAAPKGLDVGRAELSVTKNLVTSWLPTKYQGRVYIGSRENTVDERNVISAFSEREKLALVWILKHSSELISFAIGTDRISSDVLGFWRVSERAYELRSARALSAVLSGYGGQIIGRNNHEQRRLIIQPALASIGLYSRSAGGLGAEVRATRDAVEVFQKRNGRLVSGYADSIELEMLAELLETDSDFEATTVDATAELTRLRSQIAQLQATAELSRQLASDRLATIRTLRAELSSMRSSSEFDPDTEASAELRRQLEAANATIADLQADSVPRSELERLEERLVTMATALAVASAPTVLPTFDAATTPISASVSEHCNSINVLTSTNGGFTTLGAMTNPAFVLNEQFCLARTAAVAQSERAMGNVVDVTPAQLSAQCDGLGALMRPTLAALQDDNPADVINDVQATLTGSGQSMEQLASAGVVCLGLGYQADKAGVALGSALLMVGTGHSAYGEIVAHQLRGGFGTEQCEACADAWMTATIASLEDGAAPAFLPNQSADRIALLKAANAAQ